MNPRLFVLVLLAGCVLGEESGQECRDGKCDGSGESCSDKRYGDGACDPQLACAAPDIDCFETFADDASAATWFAGFEAQLAAEEHRAPRTLLTPAHPLWAKTRKLLDDGWAAFQANRPVGALAEARPALVLVEDASANAFVAPDLTSGKAGFAVMVQTGLFETGGSDDGAFGIMMHEFQHVVGLHIVADTKERTRKFYFADTREPIGTQEPDDSLARMYGERWRSLADDAGRFHDERLRALPMGGQFQQMLAAAVTQAGAATEPACMQARAQLSAIANGIAGQIDPITSEIDVAADVPAKVDEGMAALETACFTGFTRDAIGVLAAMNQTTPAMIEAAMDPSDVTLVKGKRFVDGYAALVIDRRAKLRQLEADLQRKHGKPWSRLRYFSTEEDADDISVTVLRGANVEPAYAITDFFVSFLSADGKTRCTALLAAREVPPYGVDLTDEHHGTCWRAHHARQFAEAHDKARVRDDRAPFAPSTPMRVPIPRPLRERLAY